MSDRSFYAHFNTMTDDQLRLLFNETLENPGSVNGEHAHAWRKWLVETLLDYFFTHPPQSVTDQCRYSAFALRYLAPIEAGSAAPVRVQQVLTVMATRSEVITALLFGPVEIRRAAIRAAFGHPADWEQPDLDAYQEASMQTFMERFEERGNGTGISAFDDSTVARWSRDMIPELERLVLERIKPARQIARGVAIQKMVAKPKTETAGSDRAKLLAYLELFEDGPLSIHFGVALAALNNYDRRAASDERQFNSQRRLFGVLVLLIGVAAGALILSPWSSLPDWLHTPMLLAAFVAGMGVVVTLLYLFVRIVVGTIMLTEHITQTRTDIQTLQQLAGGGETEQDSRDPANET